MLYFVEILGEEEVKKNAEELHQWLPIWIKTWLEHEIIEVESSRTLWGDICHTRPYFIGVQFCFQQNIRHSITQCNTVHTWWAIVDGASSTHGNKHWVAQMLNSPLVLILNHSFCAPLLRNRRAFVLELKQWDYTCTGSRWTGDEGTRRVKDACGSPYESIPQFVAGISVHGVALLVFLFIWDYSLISTRFLEHS